MCYSERTSENNVHVSHDKTHLYIQSEHKGVNKQNQGWNNWIGFNMKNLSNRYKTQEGVATGTCCTWIIMSFMVILIIYHFMLSKVGRQRDTSINRSMWGLNITVQQVFAFGPLFTIRWNFWPLKGKQFGDSWSRRKATEQAFSFPELSHMIVSWARFPTRTKSFCLNLTKS